MYLLTQCFSRHWQSTFKLASHPQLFVLEGGEFAILASYVDNISQFLIPVDDIDIAIKFTKREIHFMSGGSSEYQFGHQFEINRIDRLQVGGDLDFIEEVALRYSN